QAQLLRDLRVPETFGSQAHAVPLAGSQTSGDFASHCCPVQAVVRAGLRVRELVEVFRRAFPTPIFENSEQVVAQNQVEPCPRVLDAAAIFPLDEVAQKDFLDSIERAILTLGQAPAVTQQTGRKLLIKLGYFVPKLHLKRLIHAEMLTDRGSAGNPPLVSQGGAPSARAPA